MVTSSESDTIALFVTAFERARNDMMIFGVGSKFDILAASDETQVSVEVMIIGQQRIFQKALFSVS